MASQIPYDGPSNGRPASISTASPGRASPTPSGSNGEKKLETPGDGGEATLHSAGGEGYIDAEKATNAQPPASRVLVDGEGESFGRGHFC